jgi:hypothetical protein
VINASQFYNYKTRRGRGGDRERGREEREKVRVSYEILL